MAKRVKKWQWQDDFDRIAAFSQSHGGEVVKATDAHVAFRYIKGKVRVVFYPHRAPSASGHNLRARVEGADRDASLQAIREINRFWSGTEYRVKNRGWPGSPYGAEWLPNRFEEMSLPPLPHGGE